MRLPTVEFHAGSMVLAVAQGAAAGAPSPMGDHVTLYDMETGARRRSLQLRSGMSQLWHVQQREPAMRSSATAPGTRDAVEGTGPGQLHARADAWLQILMAPWNGEAQYWNKPLMGRRRHHSPCVCHVSS